MTRRASSCSCLIIPATPLLELSVSIINGLPKRGAASIGAVGKAFFNFFAASSNSGVQRNGVSFRECSQESCNIGEVVDETHEK